MTYEQAIQYGITINPSGYSVNTCPPATWYFPPSVTVSYPSGAQEIYLYQNGYFLSQLIDPQGNVTTLNYDVVGQGVQSNPTGYQRLRTVTAPSGEVLQFNYDPNSLWQLTSVQEPSGATAHFGYNSNGELSRVSDALNLTSTFTYDAVTQDQIDSMSTPYGNWTFTTQQVDYQDIYGPNPVQSLDIIDPMGQHQRAQYGQLLYNFPSEPLPAGMALSGELSSDEAWWGFRDTYYWDANTMAQSGADYSKAMVYHYQHTAVTNEESGVLESTKHASQARVFNDYPGQVDPIFNSGEGIFKPEDVARVLDDGTTQLDHYQYNSIGMVTQHIDPAGRELNYQYDSTNLIDLLSVSDGSNEMLASFQYNGPPHRPTTIFDAGNEATRLGYNSAGQLTSVQLPTGESTTLQYNNNGFLTSITPPAPGTTVNFTPDSAGRIATSSDATNGTLAYDYDALNRLRHVRYPDGSYEEIIYNRLDVASTRDRDGRLTQYSYDAARRPTGILDPANHLVQLAWCQCGALSALIDADGHTTSWAHDILGNVIGKTYPDQSQVTYQYENTVSRLHAIVDELKQETLFTYNVANQLTGIQYSNTKNPTPNVAFSYEPILGRLSSMIDGTGSTNFLYNPISANTLGAGWLATVNGPLQNSAVQYGYDASGRVTSVGVNGVAETYNYNPFGQLAGVTNPLGTFGYQYSGSTGQLSLVNLPNGATTALTYYNALQSGRLQEITHSGPSGMLAQYGYGYDPAGQITSWTQQQGTNPVKTLLLEYDLAGQLTGTAETWGNGGAANLAWAYDLAGNRTQSTFNGIPTVYTPNNLNQLTQISPNKMKVAGLTSVSATVMVNGVTATSSANNGFGVWVSESAGSQVLTVTAQSGSGSLTQHYQVVNGQTLTYDLNGNMTSDGIHQYDWDAANRLIRISDLHPTVGNPAHISEFTYDGLWRRVEMKEKQGLQTVADRKFVWAGAEIKEERDQSNNVVKRFYGSGVQVVQGPLGGVYLYTRDHLGSFRGVLDGAGNQVAAYDYDVWGNRTQTAGTFVADFGYAGYIEHAPSGLKLTWYRGYSATLGIWINRDPIGEKGGFNLYSYVANNPVSFEDPLGLAPNWPVVTQGAIQAAGGAVGIFTVGFTGVGGVVSLDYYITGAGNIGMGLSGMNANPDLAATLGSAYTELGGSSANGAMISNVTNVSLLANDIAGAGQTLSSMAPLLLDAIGDFFGVQPAQPTPNNSSGCSK